MKIITGACAVWERCRNAAPECPLEIRHYAANRGESYQLLQPVENGNVITFLYSCQDKNERKLFKLA